jgi:hypothetical protein
MGVSVDVNWPFSRPFIRLVRQASGSSAMGYFRQWLAVRTAHGSAATAREFALFFRRSAGLHRLGLMGRVRIVNKWVRGSATASVGAFITSGAGPGPCGRWDVSWALP